MQFTLSLGCPLNCAYCPQSAYIKNYKKYFGECDELNIKEMNFELFKKCLKNLALPENGGEVCFGGFSEPTTNKDFLKMVKYANDLGYTIALSSSLIGLDLDQIQELSKYNIKDFTLHIADNENNSKFRVDEAYIKKIKYLHNTGIPIDAYSCHGSIHNKIKSLINPDKAFHNYFYDRAGLVNHKDINKLPLPHKGKLVCGAGKPAGEACGGEKLIVLPNGYGVFCCSDFSLKYLVGDVANQSFPEIIKNANYRKIIKEMDDENLSSLCRICACAIQRPEMRTATEFVPNMCSNNAIKLGLYLNDYVSFKLNSKSQFINNILQKISSASHIIIFGLGKLFKDNFFISSWNEVINPDFLCDSNSDLWGTNINGIPVIAPHELKLLREREREREQELDPLVITWVKNDRAIKEKLQGMGITNVINAYEIFNMFD